MPSLFEPCGLSQLMALRLRHGADCQRDRRPEGYGMALQRVRGTGTGFSFANYNAHEMLDTIRYAKHVFYNRKREWNKIIDRAMAADFSWDSSALKYQELYDWLIGY